MLPGLKPVATNQFQFIFPLKYCFIMIFIEATFPEQTAHPAFTLRQKKFLQVLFVLKFDNWYTIFDDILCLE